MNTHYIVPVHGESIEVTDFALHVSTLLKSILESAVADKDHTEHIRDCRMQVDGLHTAMNTVYGIFSKHGAIDLAMTKLAPSSYTAIKKLFDSTIERIDGVRATLANLLHESLDRKQKEEMEETRVKIAEMDRKYAEERGCT